MRKSECQTRVCLGRPHLAVLEVNFVLRGHLKEHLIAAETYLGTILAHFANKRRDSALATGNSSKFNPDKKISPADK